jgi:ribosome-associated protein
MPLPAELRITARWSIPARELSVEWSRSSGPGGQNVNKLNTNCRLRWNLESSSSVSEAHRAVLRVALKSRLTIAGDLFVESQKTRYADTNLMDCVERFIAMLATPLRPKKKRKATVMSRGVKTARKAARKRQSDKKSQRRWRPSGND